jgi:hypothetical protein
VDVDQVGLPALLSTTPNMRSAAVTPSVIVPRFPDPVPVCTTVLEWVTGAARFWRGCLPWGDRIYENMRFAGKSGQNPISNDYVSPKRASFLLSRALPGRECGAIVRPAYRLGPGYAGRPRPAPLRALPCRRSWLQIRSLDFVARTHADIGSVVILPDAGNCIVKPL